MSGGTLSVSTSAIIPNRCSMQYYWSRCCHEALQDELEVEGLDSPTSMVEHRLMVVVFLLRAHWMKMLKVHQSSDGQSGNSQAVTAPPRPRPLWLMRWATVDDVKLTVVRPCMTHILSALSTYSPLCGGEYMCRPREAYFS